MKCTDQSETEFHIARLSAEGRKKLNDDTASAIISDRKVIRKKTKARMGRWKFVGRRSGRNENHVGGFHLFETSASDTKGMWNFNLNVKTVTLK